MYAYDEIDRTLINERVTEFRDQVKRRLSGELTEDEFKSLRLMNGVYLQLHAYMFRVAIPYGTLSSEQMRRLAHVARRYDRGYGHLTTRQNIQFNWIKLAELPDALADLAEVGIHAMQTSGNCTRNITAINGPASHRARSRIRGSGPSCCGNIRRCTRNSRSCHASSNSPSPHRNVIARRSRCTTSACACTRTPMVKPASRCWSAAGLAAPRSSAKP